MSFLVSSLPNDTPYYLLHVNTVHCNVNRSKVVLSYAFQYIQELKELPVVAYRNTTEENRAFRKPDLSQAIRGIQKEYDQKVDQIRDDMERFYKPKVKVYSFIH